MKANKKGQQGLDKFIISAVVIGIILVIGIFISASLQDNLREAASESVTNETLTTVTETGEYLTASTRNDVVCTIVTVTNTTSGTVISSGNYTQTNCNLAFTGADTQFNNTNWNVTYTDTYSAETSSSNASGALVISLSSGSAWITILIVVGFATIVLGMLTRGLGKQSTEIESAYTY